MGLGSGLGLGLRLGSGLGLGCRIPNSNPKPKPEPTQCGAVSTFLELDNLKDTLPGLEYFLDAIGRA